MDYNTAAQNLDRVKDLPDEVLQAHAEQVLRNGGPSTLVFGEGHEPIPAVTPPQ
ncbi:hypothetical protein [Streptomyces globisporus]|uniref:hypothetical protein n=1 Tax=Streptomyces globisporus TaxID=1908 RepID=UPI003795538A